MDKHTRILVADDHATSRRGLRALLATCPATEVIGESTRAAMEAARAWLEDSQAAV